MHHLINNDKKKDIRVIISHTNKETNRTIDNKIEKKINKMNIGNTIKTNKTATLTKMVTNLGINKMEIT